MKRYSCFGKKTRLSVAALVCIVLFLPSSVFAHGFAGKRFFPTTFQVDDPFISDEFSMLFGSTKDTEARSNSLDIEYSKRITPNFGLTLGESYENAHFIEGGSANGFGNLDAGLKYQFYTNEEHETILSAGLSVEIGGTGAKGIGSSSFSTYSPALFFGRGFGDLPESMKYLRPFAITGVVGPNFPSKTDPNTFTWALSLQYSLIYLQSFVKDVGLGTPLNRMVLVVEFPMETCLNRDCSGQTTGTVNPGIVWFGKHMELGLAAQVPANERTGKNVGVLGLVHLFLDDIFPNSIGKPVLP